MHMPVQNRREYKVLAAITAGALVWVVSSIADVALLPLDRALMVRQIVANFIAGLMAVVVTLAIQLKHEEVHNRVAMERAAMVSELNHHVRNAVFPLFVAVHRLGDTDAKKTADDAVERINAALRDATADALARKVDYAPAVESSHGIAA